MRLTTKEPGELFISFIFKFIFKSLEVSEKAFRMLKSFKISGKELRILSNFKTLRSRSRPSGCRR